MSYTVNYKKIHDLGSLHLDVLGMREVQCYSPVLEKLFVLNKANNNKVMLASRANVSCVLTKESYNVFTCELDTGKKEPLFVKFSPLFDPIKYAMGKVRDLSNNCKILPKFEANNLSFISDYNNVSVVDGLFTYVSGMLYNDFNFIHGVNYFGSFMGLHEKLQYNRMLNNTYV